ncbi:hypothetical protein IFM46972_11201 [Aspergillus udagawae]|uniref:SH3 domain-containing protein n=1 Tax=Aspergillus udagawae TaxID=91492 RepID=A0A8H3SG75_9EURO|nr:hypothetical protein IFM46972_11201 [Aspergillus udagawae]
MVHCRVQCMQCDVAFCSSCMVEDARGCWEDHEHKRVEHVLPPEIGVLEVCEPCRVCPSKGSTAHCTWCGQGLESGQAVTQCFTCVKVYGASAAYCPSCLPCCKREHDPAHEWKSFVTIYKISSADANLAECKCDECQQKIDLSSPNNIYKHSHNSFVMSFGQNAWREIVKQSWKECNNKPVKDIDLENRELLSKSDFRCSLCGSGFLNLAKIHICLTCIITYCSSCFEEGPGKAHEHGCTALYINCQEPPNNLHQLPQQNYQQNCFICKETINLWREQNLTCTSCKNWFVCPSCIMEKGSTIHHDCSEVLTPNLIFDDTYPMDRQWWSRETVLLARQVNLNIMPLAFVIATTRFDKKDAEDMSVRFGDRIIVTGYPKYDNWYYGRNDWSGQTGVFPKPCVQVDEDAVKFAQEYDWLQTEEQLIASREREMQHKEKKLEFWGKALQFGAAILSGGGDS